jgi:hypothetical protein
MNQLKSPNLKRHEIERNNVPGRHIDLRDIQQRKVVAIGFVTFDAF